MRNKILTVDDSKTVRIIVRKAFKAFDCEILEAANGVEGLAIAAKEMPDLILLDVTMPVMDGVEMLTKIKSDPQLKGIPIMMLTAEGGKDNVLKVAKIGVRDYIVKPFKEDVLIEKAGRIIELKPLSDSRAKARSIFDPATLLVVEDKPAIVQQIQEGLKTSPWKVHGVSSQAEAVDFCTKTPPDLIMISLSLPEDAAFALFRLIRTNIKTKYTPVFGLVVKTETGAQQQAQTVGFTTVITKPIDISELETKVAKAMNLDTSQRYFTIETGTLVMRVPENCSTSITAEISTYLKPKLSEAVDAGHNKAVIDVHLLRSLHMGIIKLLVQAMQTCRELGVHYALVGNAHIIGECKGFEDTRTWAFFDTIEEAKASLTKVPAPTPALANATP
jgi:two-component system cell cycle response regulator